MLVLARKFMFCLIVNLPKAPEQQTLLGIMCLIPYIALVQGQRPYTSWYLNWMDLLGASLATALALSGLVMFGGYVTTLTSQQVRTRLLRSTRQTMSLQSSGAHGASGLMPCPAWLLCVCASLR